MILGRDLISWETKEITRSWCSRVSPSFVGHLDHRLLPFRRNFLPFGLVAHNGMEVSNNQGLANGVVQLGYFWMAARTADRVSAGVDPATSNVDSPSYDIGLGDGGHGVSRRWMVNETRQG